MANDAGKIDVTDSKVDELLNSIRMMDPRLHPRAYLDAVLALRQETASRELAGQLALVWKPIREVRDVLGSFQSVVANSTSTVTTAIGSASSASEVFAKQLAKSTDQLARWTKWLAVATVVVAVATIGTLALLTWQEIEKSHQATEFFFPSGTSTPTGTTPPR